MYNITSCIHTKTMDTCADSFPADNLSCFVSCLADLGAFVVVASSVATTSTLAFVVAFVVTITAGATVVEWTGCCMTLGMVRFAILSPQVTKRRPVEFALHSW